VRATSPGKGHGATFTVALPRVAAQAPASTVRPTAEPSLVGRRILLVEDEPVTAQTLGACLGVFGADVVLASSVPEALTVIAQRPVDILLADIGLPGEDGYSLIRQIRRTEDRTGTPPVRALAVTAYARPEDRAQALAAGFHGHLAKPIDPTLLVQEIGKLVAVAPVTHQDTSGESRRLCVFGALPITLERAPIPEANGGAGGGMLSHKQEGGLVRFSVLPPAVGVEPFLRAAPGCGNRADT
jgi:CheY-like chemotaxis protein